MRTTMGGIGPRVLVAAAACVAMAGCYNHTYHVGAGATPADPVVYDHWRNHWLGGLISPGQELVISEVCPSGNATVYQEVSFLNGLVGSLTSGIYVPTTVKIRCAGGVGGQNADGTGDIGADPGIDLEIDPVTIAGFVSGPDFLEWIEAAAPHRLAEAISAQAQLDR